MEWGPVVVLVAGCGGGGVRGVTSLPGPTLRPLRRRSRLVAVPGDRFPAEDRAVLLNDPDQRHALAATLRIRRPQPPRQQFHHPLAALSAEDPGVDARPF